MAPSTPYFDLLDDDVAQRVIQSIPTNRGAYSWQDLAATCRRMCTLVRYRTICVPCLHLMAECSTCHCHSN
jgi:hypothetical protein